MINLFLTLLVGLIFGYAFFRVKIPGGMMVGSIFGVAAFNILTGTALFNGSSVAAYKPGDAKGLAQILAGAFIGCSVDKKDLARLKHIVKPLVVLFFVYLVLNILAGFLIYSISPLDLATSLMCAVPGGISDIPLISADMGADVPKVALLQFTRLVIGIGFFPSMINYVGKREESAKTAEKETVEKKPGEPRTPPTAKSRILILALTLSVAAVCGVIGKITGMPAGVLVFSLAGTICLKIFTGKAYLPVYMKRFAQMLSGAYIGCLLTYKDVLELKNLLLPALVLIVGYSLACVIIGWIMRRYCNMSLKEGMLAGTPAGASDMALISSDMGVHSSDLIVLQVIRLIMAVSVFPIIINIVLKLAGSV